MDASRWCQELEALKVKLEFVRSAMQEVRRKREAVVRKESAHTRRSTSGASRTTWMSRDDMDVEMNENTEELSFMAIAGSNSADWHEPHMCDGQCRKNGFKHHDIASVLVEKETTAKPHTMNLCKACYSVRQGERKELAVNSGMRNMLVAEKRSTWQIGDRPKIMEIYAARKIHTKKCC